MPDHPPAAPGSDDYCYVTTTGRRTGRPHRIEIWYAAHAGVIYLLAGGGRSADWVRNLLESPQVEIEVDGQVRAATARVVEDVGEAARARSLLFDKYTPRYDGDLAGWRDSALPVAIEREVLNRSS